MATLLLLGGSEQQTIAITKAKALGFRAVLCDYLPDNPGQHFADKFYLVSTTDKEAVLEVAKKENIDGVVAYSSDPAAPTAAYIAEKLGLPGLNYEMTLNFCEKHLFRAFLKSHGFNVPQSVQFNYQSGKVPTGQIQDFSFPLIVKPTDSSGSKGVSVVSSNDELPAALDYAFQYSRNGVLIVEEFIQRFHEHVIEAEISVVNGEVVTWGLINSVRDAIANPLLPAAYSFPLEITPEEKQLVISEITKLVQASKMVSGNFNIEMIISQNGKLYFLDAGPRNGGNKLPEYISLISGGDIVSATLESAMGITPDDSIYLPSDAEQCYGLAVLHSAADKTFNGLKFSEEAQKALVRKELMVKPGDKISSFKNSNGAFGFAFFKFENEDQKRSVMNHLSDHIEIL